ncbi:DUF6671 family protein [Lacimicrobium alkaliphilum]|nr:DUF6671 family protein [Lacimicrobium alkaliphilum]
MHNSAKNRHHPYFQASACLLTKHKKERVIAPVLRQALGIELKVDDTFDTHQVFAEWDFRAQYCPCRMQTIAKAAEQLAGHLLRLCPQCRAPGYHPFKSLAGLPCEQCQTPTGTVMGRYYRCAVCQAQHFEPVSDEFSNPFNCSICNP